MALCCGLPALNFHTKISRDLTQVDSTVFDPWLYFTAAAAPAPAQNGSQNAAPLSCDYPKKITQRNDARPSSNKVRYISVKELNIIGINSDKAVSSSVLRPLGLKVSRITR